MANVRISDLAAAAALVDAMQLEVESAAPASERVTAAQVFAYVLAKLAPGGATAYGRSLLELADAVALAAEIDVASGIYAPTIGAVTNVDAASNDGNALYMRSGAIVHVAGRVDIDPTAGGGTTTEISIELPIASDFAQNEHVCGTLIDVQGRGGSVFADSADDTARARFPAQHTASSAYTYMFTYRIL